MCFSRGKEKQTPHHFNCLTQMSYTNPNPPRHPQDETQFYLQSPVAPSSTQTNICSAWLKLFIEISLPEKKRELISPEQCVITLNCLFSCRRLPSNPLWRLPTKLLCLQLTLQRISRSPRCAGPRDGGLSVPSLAPSRSPQRGTNPTRRLVRQFLPWCLLQGITGGAFCWHVSR